MSSQSHSVLTVCCTNCLLTESQIESRKSRGIATRVEVSEALNVSHHEVFVLPFAFIILPFVTPSPKDGEYTRLKGLAIKFSSGFDWDDDCHCWKRLPSLDSKHL